MNHLITPTALKCSLTKCLTFHTFFESSYKCIHFLVTKLLNDVIYSHLHAIALEVSRALRERTVQIELHYTISLRNYYTVPV